MSEKISLDSSAIQKHAADRFRDQAARFQYLLKNILLDRSH